MQLKNYLTKFMATLALCLLTTSAMAQDRLIFSHDTGQGITGNLGNVGNAIMQNYDVAMRIKDPNFVGMKIAAIRVPMENADHLSNLRVWLSKELTLKTINGKKTNVPDILSVNADITGEWVTVNLAEPYTITEEGALWSPAYVIENEFADSGATMILQGPLVPQDCDPNDAQLWENRIG